MYKGEEYYNKLWLENKELIQKNIDKLNTKRFALEMELIDKEKEIERLKSIIKEVREHIDKFIKANYEDVFNQEQKEYMVKILQMLDKENKDGER